jgi:hypothetical protein
MTKSSTSKGVSGKARHTRRGTTPKLDAEKTRHARRETNSKVDTDKAHDADRKTASVAAEKVRHGRGEAAPKMTTPKLNAKKTRHTRRETNSKVDADAHDAERKTASVAAEKVRHERDETAPKVAAEKPRAAAHKIDFQVEEAIESHGNSAPKVAVEKPSDADHEAAADFERAAQVPDSMRALAGRNVAQMQERYESSAKALQTAYKNWEKSCDAFGQGAMALNRKIIDIAERNIGSGFDLAKSLAGAKDIAEVVEVQISYCRKQFVELRMQAEEVRALLQKVAASVVTKPR